MACDGLLTPCDTGYHRSETGLVLCDRCAMAASRAGASLLSSESPRTRRRVAQHEEATVAETVARKRAGAGSSPLPPLLSRAHLTVPSRRRKKTHERTRASTIGNSRSRSPTPPTSRPARRSAVSRQTDTSPYSQPSSKAVLPTTPSPENAAKGPLFEFLLRPTPPISAPRPHKGLLQATRRRRWAPAGRRQDSSGWLLRLA